jgi:hypothetical protein
VLLDEPIRQRRRLADVVALGVVDAHPASKSIVAWSPTISATVRLPSPRAMSTTAWMTSWSVRLSMHERTNSPSIFR